MQWLEERRTVGLNTRLDLPRLLHAGYNVKLNKIFDLVLLKYHIEKNIFCYWTKNIKFSWKSTVQAYLALLNYNYVYTIEIRDIINIFTTNISSNEISNPHPSPLIIRTKNNNFIESLHWQATELRELSQVSKKLTGSRPRRT